MALAYSYIRFSSSEQRKGDSLRRQQVESARYAEEHGLTLDTTLNINDLGTSAFRGKNVLEGGLGAFLAAVENGTVQKGSFLLVENFDRLTRMEPASAFALLQSIVAKGVTVVTLSDKRQYTAESLNRDITQLLMSLVTMHRAHEESRLKGIRVRAAWAKKKNVDARTGKPITNMTPVWLRVNNGAFEVIEEKAAAVKRIFSLATEEGLGQRAIVTRLINEKIQPIGKISRWTETSVRRIIQNVAVIGTYQPRSINTSDPSLRENDGEAIEGYYPPVVSSQQFYYAQTLREKAMIPRGPRGENLGTIFTGLVFCGMCGATMRRKGASANDVFIRLRCSASCGMPSWKYDTLQILVLGVLEQDLLPHLDNRGGERAQLQEKINEADRVHQEIQHRLVKILDAIEISQNPVEMLLSRAEKLDLERIEAKNTAESLRNDLRLLEARSFNRNFIENPDNDGIREILAGSPDTPPEKVRYALSRAVDKITLCQTNGIKTVCIAVGNETRHFDFDDKNLMWSCRESAWKTRVIFPHPLNKNQPVLTP